MSRAAAHATPPILGRRPARPAAHRPAPRTRIRPATARAKPAAPPTARPRAIAASRSSAERRLSFFVFASLIVGALAAGVVSMQALVSQSSFRMQDLQQRTQQLEQSYGQLKLTVAELSSPQRVAAAASKMGLILPNRVATLHVRTPPHASPRRQTSGAISFALKSLLGEHP